MTQFKEFVPHGVIPAALLPFHGDFSIDEVSFKSHYNVENDKVCNKMRLL